MKQLLRHKVVTLIIVCLVLITTLASIVLWYPTPPTVQATRGFVSISLGTPASVHPASAISVPIGEVIPNRTLTSSTSYLGNGQYSTDSSISAVHYQDAQGNWQNIDNSINSVNAAYAWQTSGSASFQVNFTNTFGAGMMMKVNSANQSISLQPSSLDWTNNTTSVSNTGTSQLVASPHSVTANVTNLVMPLIANQTYHVGTITYNTAYGPGTHFSWACTTTKIAKLLTIDSLAALPTPNTNVLSQSNPVLRLTLFFLPSTGVNIFVDGQQWNKSTTRQTFNIIEFRDSITSKVLWGFDSLRYWDSTLKNEGQSVATLRWTGAYLSIEIRVPYAWLQTATFPVYLDTTIDTQVGASADDGYTYGSDIDNSGSSMNVGYGGYYTYDLWTTFTGITIPKFSTISVAYVNYSVAAIAGTPLTTLYAEKANSPSSPSSYSDYYSRVLTTDNVNWDGMSAAYPTYINSPSIVSIIQELVNAYAYSNQAIQIFEKNRSSPSSNYASWNTYDEIYYPPKLHIEYMAITSYLYTKKLNFNTTSTGANVTSSNQTSFPICVDINSSSWTTASELTNFFGAYNVGGKRIQFFDADNMTNLPYEVELYNSPTEAIYWVRVPQVDGNSSTDSIEIAFGNDPTSSNQDNATGVWDANYLFVSHLFDYGNTSTVLDSTTNNRASTKYSAAHPATATGIANSAQNSGGTNDKISVPDSNDWAFTTFTLESWVNWASVSGNWWERAIIAQDAGGGANNKWIFAYDYGAHATTFHINDATQTGPQLSGNTWTASTGNWYDLGITGTSGGNYAFYRAGVADGTASSAFAIPNVAHVLNLFYGEGTSNTLNGLLDEVRISKIVRTADWMKLSYYTVKKTTWNGDAWLSWDAAGTSTPSSISNTPTSYAFGTVGLNSTPSTGLAYFSLTNGSSFGIDVTVKGTDMTGGDNWTLSDTATPGSDIIGFKTGTQASLLAVGFSGGDQQKAVGFASGDYQAKTGYVGQGDYSVIVRKNTTYNTLIYQMPVGAIYKWGLKFYTPSSITDGVAKTGTITLTAAVDPSAPDGGTSGSGLSIVGFVKQGIVGFVNSARKVVGFAK